MKKLLSAVLAISLLLSLTACGGKTTAPPPSGEPAVSEPADIDPGEQEEVPDQETAASAPEEPAVSAPEEITPTNAQVGNMLYYGQFEQDGDPENGMEALEWVVLDKTDDRILVITRFSILNEAYCANVENGGTCWAESDIRLGLNSSDFLNIVFSEEEQARICESVIQTERWKGDFASSDEETVDRLFLLSSQEAYQYFVTDEERCPGNTTAVNLNASTEKEWWTRTPIGDRAYDAIYVSPNTIVWPSGIAHDGAPVIEGFGLFGLPCGSARRSKEEHEYEEAFALTMAWIIMLGLTACGNAPTGTPAPVTPPDAPADSSVEEPAPPVQEGEPIVAVTHPDFQLTDGFVEPVEQLTEAPEGFIPITTAGEFSKLGLNKTASYILMNDIDLSNLYWGPIALFSGTLDGNGHRIIGAGNVLFEHIDGGTIRNLGVESKDLRASHAVLVNELTDGVLYNCYSTGAVQCVPDGYGVAGGLVQQAENYTILSCRNDADVSFASPEEDRGFLGGIVAESKGNGIITNCLNTGDITCVSVDPDPYFASGGIVGKMDAEGCSTVTYCRNEGTITGRTAAGLVGSLHMGKGDSGNIALSCNTGTVSGAAAAYGICGVVNDKTDTQCGLYISSCYNAGELPQGGVGIAGSPDAAFTHCSIIGCYSHTSAPIDGGISSFFTDLQNCYFNDVTANATPNGALFASVQALSEEQMRDPDSYKGFDFDIGMGGWQMGSGDYPYPVLPDRNYLGAEVG